MHTVVRRIGLPTLGAVANGVVEGSSVDMQSGEYTIYCDVRGHRYASMEAPLEVV
jgi:hypothetical protein